MIWMMLYEYFPPNYIELIIYGHGFPFLVRGSFNFLDFVNDTSNALIQMRLQVSYIFIYKILGVLLLRRNIIVAGSFN